MQYCMLQRYLAQNVHKEQTGLKQLVSYNINILCNVKKKIHDQHITGVLSERII
jgi:hypothetical protein